MRHPEGGGSAEGGGPTDNQGRVGGAAAPLPLTRGGGKAATTPWRRKSPSAGERSRRRVLLSFRWRKRENWPCPRHCTTSAAGRACAPPPLRHSHPPSRVACSLAIFGTAGTAVTVYATLFLRPWHCRRRGRHLSDSVLCVVAAAFIVLAVYVFSILGVAGAAVVVPAVCSFAVLAKHAPFPPLLCTEQCWVRSCCHCCYRVYLLLLDWPSETVTHKINLP